MRLSIATTETLDDTLALAARHFFSGSEVEARTNLGPLDPFETTFLLAYLAESPIATATVQWNSSYPPFAAEEFPSFRTSQSGQISEARAMVAKCWMRSNSWSRCGSRNSGSASPCSTLTGRTNAFTPSAAISRMDAGRVIASHRFAGGIGSLWMTTTCCGS